MPRRALRRLVLIIPTLLGVASLVFAFLHLVPGDPVEIMLGESAAPADVAALRHDLGLDRPLPAQYARFLARAARGDLGQSIAFRAPVAEVIADRYPATLELAGTAYKQEDFRTATERLRKALDLYPQDAYSREFLATIYFLDGNLEAALKYWNPEDKPRLRHMVFAPPLRLKESLRNRAIAFNAPQILSQGALLTTQARLDNLGVFSNWRIELTPADSEYYDATLHVFEGMPHGGIERLRIDELDGSRYLFGDLAGGGADQEHGTRFLGERSA